MTACPVYIVYRGLKNPSSPDPSWVECGSFHTRREANVFTETNLAGDVWAIGEIKIVAMSEPVSTGDTG